jgi:hypothetical protein
MLAGSYATLSHALNPLNWNYAAALATAIQKRFFGPLARENPPKFLFLKSNPLVAAMIAQKFLKTHKL